MQDQTPRRYVVVCDDCKTRLHVSRPDPETLPAHNCAERFAARTRAAQAAMADVPTHRVENERE